MAASRKKAGSSIKKRQGSRPSDFDRKVNKLITDRLKEIQGARPSDADIRRFLGAKKKVNRKR